MNKRAISIVILMLLIAAITATAAAGCGVERTSEAAQGESTVELIVEVTGASGETTTFNVMTSETTVGAALLEHGLISGDETEYGLMVTFVNGQRAVFEEDGAYWAFYIDGEFALEGVDTTAAEPGKVYAFVYTEA